MAETQDRSRVVQVGSGDLPLHCPTAGAPLWQMHPRVFLDVAKTGEVLCPYCGTRYKYTGPRPAGH
jgi:uncharacterized Zn-finger protein